MTESEHIRYLDQIETFRVWFDENVVSEEDQGTILVLPYGVAVPKYRDAPHEYVFHTSACQDYLNNDLETNLFQ